MPELKTIFTDLAFCLALCVTTGLLMLSGHMILSACLIPAFFYLFIFRRWPEIVTGGDFTFSDRTAQLKVLYTFVLIYFIPVFLPFGIAALNLIYQWGALEGLLLKLYVTYRDFYEFMEPSYFLSTVIGFIQTPIVYRALQHTDIVESVIPKATFLVFALQNIIAIILSFLIGMIIYLSYSTRIFMKKGRSALTSQSREALFFMFMCFCFFMITANVVFGRSFSPYDQLFKILVLSGVGFVIPILGPYCFKKDQEKS